MKKPGYYTLKQQRATYLLTIHNDLVLKTQDGQAKYFEQIGAGRKAFKQRWDNVLFRAVVNLALPIIMLMLDLYLPVRDAIRLLFHKKNSLDSKRLFIGYSRQLYTISKKACLQKDDDYWFKLEDGDYILPEQKPTVTVFDFIKYGEIAKSAVQAFILHLSAIVKFGYDKYFLSYKAYEWCITDYALRHVPEDVELVYSYICDRNAILIDNLLNKNKNLIQHGTMHFGNTDGRNPYMEFHEERDFYLWKGLYKSSPARVYCYTEIDEWALSNSVIANHPDYVYIGYGFKPAFKPEKKSVLIVANYNFYSRNEEIILQQLQGLDIEIYLKNHPAIANSFYDDMRMKYQFVFIEGVDTKLPEVDLLISYDSTLANEYASIGTKVLYYGRFEIKDIAHIVKTALNLKTNDTRKSD